MELIAQLIGCNLEPSLGGSMDFPEIHLNLGRGHECSLSVELRLQKDKRVFVIETRVGWSSSHYAAQEAAYLASLHVLAAQKAAIAESVAWGRSWLASEVMPDEKMPGEEEQD